MPKHAQVSSQIKGLIRFLQGEGLVDDQKGPRRINVRGTVTVSFDGAEHLKSISQNPSYAGVYLESSQRGMYTIKMLDEALVQLHYVFRRQQLIRHRLAFLPHPWLGGFHLNREDYLQSNINVDTIASGWPPTPFRFDFDRDSHRDVVHPAAHFTLGSIGQCRIPVTRPLTPRRFVDFLLRNFYDSPEKRYSASLPKQGKVFQETISQAETEQIHMVVPTRGARKAA